MSISLVRNQIRQRVNKKHKEYLENILWTKNGKPFINKTSEKRTGELIQQNRIQLRRLTRLPTVYFPFGVQLKKIQLIENRTTETLPWDNKTEEQTHDDELLFQVLEVIETLDSRKKGKKLS